MPDSFDPYAMPATPDWLNSGSATAPLSNELDNVDKYYDVSKYLKSMNAAAASQFGMDVAEGNNAAGEAGARALQNGTTGSVNTSMIAAQGALPGMQNVLNTKAQAADIAMKSQMANQQARASLAQSIADARTKYSSVLANYITGIRGQNITGFNESKSLDIQKSGQDNQLKSLYASLLTSPQASPDVRAWAKRMLGAGDGNFNPGYVNNSGSLTPTNIMSPTGMAGSQVQVDY